MKLYAVVVSAMEESYVRNHSGFSSEWKFDEDYTKWNCVNNHHDIIGIYGSMRKADKAISAYQPNKWMHNLDNYDVITDNFNKNHHFRVIRETGTAITGLRKNTFYHDISVEVYELNKQAD